MKAKGMEAVMSDVDTMRALATAIALLAATGAAQAAEIKAMITTAMKAAIDELLPPFERASGHNVRVELWSVRRAARAGFAAASRPTCSDRQRRRSTG